MSPGIGPGTAGASRRRAVLWTVLVFAIAVLSRELLFALDGYRDFVGSLPDPLRWLEQPVRWTVLCLIGLRLAHGLPPARMPRELGMSAPFATGLLVPFVACLPMLIVPALLGEVDPELDWTENVLFGAVVWPLGEEILFRGFAFRQLYLRGGLGVWPAAILVGVLFGLLHLGQASVRSLPLSGEIGAVAIVSLGGILFAWLFARWDDSLWMAFGAHLFMNLWWSVFDLGDSPVGGWLPNVLRLLSVVILVALTLTRGRWHGKWAGTSAPASP